MGSPLRNRLNEELKESLLAKKEISTATIRLILAALKDRDISARAKGNSEGISDDEILSLLQTMLKQRAESVKMYKDGGRVELADREEAESAIIQTFLPAQLDEGEVGRVVEQAIVEVDASSIKDMGKVMAILKTQYAGQMDFGKASQIVKERLV